MTINNTSESSAKDYGINFDVQTKTVKVARAVILIIIALSTYYGNTLILVCLKKFSTHLKGIQFILLGNLAVADLLLAVGLTFEVIGTIFVSLDINWSFCVVKLLVVGTSLGTSGRLLLVISIDRFFAIMFPMKHLANVKRKRYRRTLIVAVWAFSVSVTSIPFFVRLRSPRVLKSCHIGRLIPQVMSIYASVFILLQFCINVILCLIIMWRLRTNTMSRQKYRSSITKCGYWIKGYVLYFLCWLPFVVSSILMTISNNREKYASAREYTVAPGLLHSATNWIFYGYANPKLRSAFKNVLWCSNSKDLLSSSSLKSTSLEQRPTVQEHQNLMCKNVQKTVTNIKPDLF